MPQRIVKHLVNFSSVGGAPFARIRLVPERAPGPHFSQMTVILSPRDGQGCDLGVLVADNVRNEDRRSRLPLDQRGPIDTEERRVGTGSGAGPSRS